jgi:cell division protein FtsN
MYFVLAPREVPSEQTKTGGKGTAFDVEVISPTYTFYETLANTDYAGSEAKADDLVDSSAAVQPEKYFVLQAGSFRHEEEADTRRAELIILGLNPTIEKAQGDQGFWYRVLLGPFKSEPEVFEAIGLAVSQDIDTLIIKREGGP